MAAPAVEAREDGLAVAKLPEQRSRLTPSSRSKSGRMYSYEPLLSPCFVINTDHSAPRNFDITLAVIHTSRSLAATFGLEG